MKVIIFFSASFVLANILALLVFDFSLSSILETWSKIFGIIGGFSIFIAATSFLHQHKQDTAKSVVELLKLFRTEVIEEYRKLLTEVKKNYPAHSYNGTFIKEFNLVKYQIDQPASYLNQLQLIQNQQGTVFNNLQLTLLNILEEFALEVIYTDVEEHLAMEALHNPFLDMVEQNIVGMLMLASQRQNGKYPGVTSLYQRWRKIRV